MNTKQSKTQKTAQQPATSSTNAPEGGQAIQPNTVPKATKKQQAFARHYLVCQNSTQAAMLAGYAAQRAQHTGTRLLALATVQSLLHRCTPKECVAGTQKEAPQKGATSPPKKTPTTKKPGTVPPATEYMREQAAKMQPSAILTPTAPSFPEALHGSQEITGNRVLRELAAIGFASMADFCRWSTEGIELLHSGQLTKEQTAAIAEISESSTGKGAVRIKTHAKLKALEMLGRHLGIFGADPMQHDKEDPCGFSLPDDLARQLETILPAHTPHAEENDESE